jgi:GH24 family phage-related lysozyme (muramidase)
MNWANELAAWRRRNAFLARIEAKDPRPVLVSVGDSWFQFPIFLDDVIDQMGSAYSIWSLDVAGDTLDNMILRQKRHLAGLKQWKGKAKVLLVSGGGNDIVGEDPDGVSVLTKILKPFSPGKPPEWYIETGEFKRRIASLEACFSALFTEVAAEFPGVPVICHGYDRAIPAFPGDMRHPLWARQDAWLAGPLSNRLGIRDPKLQRDIVAALIDELNDMQIRLCGGNAAGRHPNAWHVDVRGKVGTRWADELHPTDDGFATVGNLFKTVLTSAMDRTETAAGPNTEAIGGPDLAVDAGLAESAEARIEITSSVGVDSFVEAAPAPLPVLSARALNLIVEYETGGRPYYEQVIRRRPIWPRGNSGVTIGFGYDLGYIDQAELDRDWAVLPAGIRTRLATALGRHGGRDSDNDMKALTAALKDIEISWELAQVVFTAATVPKFVKATARALDNTAALSPDSFGVLVSLSFNRGAAYRKQRDPSDPLDRYREMRGIGAAMTARRFDEIPGLIRLMKRIWRGTAVEVGLARRREDEAALFEAGIASMPGAGV